MYPSRMLGIAGIIFSTGAALGAGTLVGESFLLETRAFNNVNMLRLVDLNLEISFLSEAEAYIAVEDGAGGIPAWLGSPAKVAEHGDLIRVLSVSPQAREGLKELIGALDGADHARLKATARHLLAASAAGEGAEEKKTLRPTTDNRSGQGAAASSGDAPGASASASAGTSAPACAGASAPASAGASASASAGASASASPGAGVSASAGAGAGPAAHPQTGASHTEHNRFLARVAATPSGPSLASGQKALLNAELARASKAISQAIETAIQQLKAAQRSRFPQDRLTQVSRSYQNETFSKLIRAFPVATAGGLGGKDRDWIAKQAATTYVACLKTEGGLALTLLGGDPEQLVQTLEQAIKAAA